MLQRVLPIDNQQFSATLGGPIMQEPAALLRQLRIRARAEDLHLEHAVPAFNVELNGLETKRWAACVWTTSSRRRCA